MNTSAENATASNHASEGHNTSAASTTQLRHTIERTHAQISGTIDALQAKLVPPQLLASARGAIVESASQWAAQAQALGATAQTRANDLARATRDQTDYQTQQLRTWFERMRSQYPWFPAALVGGACSVIAGLAILAWLGTRSGD